MDALKAQTLPAHLIEILVVDDGSTDDTWPYLRELEGQRTNIKIFRQPNTGGPSAGRNRALAEATGEYVFFHDADDYLGPDALRRLLDLAKQQESDIVAGRISWIGRPDAEPTLNKTVLDADILDDGLWRSLTPHKLIRRRHGARRRSGIHCVLSLRRSQDQHPGREGSLPPADACGRQQLVTATTDSR